MNLIRQCRTKSLDELTREWDQLASERHRQIASGEDISFHHVVVPAVHRLLEDADISLVLDIGSGTGDFTVLLAQRADAVIAVEPSASNMALARIAGATSSNIRYVESSLEGAIHLFADESPTSAVAVMTLMNVPDLKGFAVALGTALNKPARFIAVLTHPCFWPKYWGYSTESWFHYEKEIYIEAPFTITKHRSDFITTHIHRPLEVYITIFAEQGFRLVKLVEPMPEPAVQSLYPKAWDFPRFIALCWEKA